MLALFWVELDAIEVVYLDNRTEIAAIVCRCKNMICIVWTADKAVIEICVAIRREVVQQRIVTDRIKLIPASMGHLQAFNFEPSAITGQNAKSLMCTKF